MGARELLITAFPITVTLGKKTGNCKSASIIEFDLLFNAHANNQLWQKKDRDLALAWEK
jgi:hypothetical protein